MRQPASTTDLSNPPTQTTAALESADRRLCLPRTPVRSRRHVKNP